MSDHQSTPPDPDRGEPAMTNHINLDVNSEQVNGGVQQTKPSLAQVGRQDSSETIDAKPKSTFKITSVTLHTQKGVSQDGRHSFGEEEDESAVEDSIVHTDTDDSPAPHGNLPEVKQRQDRVDNTSRFKVVKIQQKRAPYNAGRWRVSEFMSEAEPSATKVLADSTHPKRSDSGNSSRANSNHYVHGVDDPSKNPLISINNVSTNPSHPVIHQLAATQAGLPTVEASSISVSVEAAGQPAARTEHIENNVRLADETMHISSVKDPHLIGGQPSNHVVAASDTSRVAAAGTAAVAPSSNQQNSGVPILDQGTAQHNTQSVTAAGSNTSHVQHAAAALPATTPNNVAAGSSSDSQSSIVDNQQKPNPDNARGGTTPVTVKPTGLGDIQETSGGGVEALAANLTELVDPSADGEKAEDADATATGIAIDNKIEQAMDLVKSHLMLAVREEVEELKLQIKQLIERNSQLEQENKLLKSSAAPETIAQLTLLSRQQNH